MRNHKIRFCVPAACLLTFALGVPLSADHIPTDRDIHVERPPVGPTEGYLHFRTTNGGDEYTGHTDKTGRDFADNWITVQPVRLQDSRGVMPTMASEAAINADFEFIRKIYAQAGSPYIDCLPWNRLSL